MGVRRRFRKIKRLAYLGMLGGTIFAVRRARSRRDATPSVGAPATWPALQVSEEPVGAVGRLAMDEPDDSTAASDDTVQTPETVDVGAAPDVVEPDGTAVSSFELVEEPLSEVADAPAEEAPPGDLDGEIGAEGGAWVAPLDGACPLSHPIKANSNSRIYHVPGGRFYERTQVERCYADPAAAEADGYRAAKGS